MMMMMMGFKQTGPDRCCLPTHMCSRNFYLQLLLHYSVLRILVLPRLYSSSICNCCYTIPYYVYSCFVFQFYLQLLLLLNCQHCIRKTYSCFAQTVLFLNFQLLLLLLLLIPTINIVTYTLFLYSDSICNCCIATVFVLYSCFAQTLLLSAIAASAPAP